MKAFMSVPGGQASRFVVPLDAKYPNVRAESEAERVLAVAEPPADERAFDAVARSLAPRGVRRVDVRWTLVHYMAESLAAFVSA